MFIGTNSTWAWRQNFGDRFFYKFWRQAIRFVARRDDSEGNKSLVEVRPVRAQPGEEAQIEIRMTDWIALAIIASCQMVAVGPGDAQESRTASAEILTDEAIIESVTASVDRSLEYMAKLQRPDGAWDGNNAPNALALLAFMGRGHVPGRGPYRDVLEKGKRFMLRTQNAEGVFVPQRNAGSGPMYQQGLATLALAEMGHGDANNLYERWPDLFTRRNGHFFQHHRTPGGRSHPVCGLAVLVTYCRSGKWPKHNRHFHCDQLVADPHHLPDSTVTY